MELLDQTRAGLIDYTCAQLASFFPDGRNEEARKLLDRHLDETLSRLRTCINAVKMWAPEKFSYLHSSQYCQYLYYLANTIWRREQDRTVCTKLFYLNKALNGIDLFYEIEMPKVFFIGHSVGIVLAKATYGEYLVMYQNSTVGKNHGQAPELGAGAIMYPNTAVIGNCVLGANTTISQGAGLIDQGTPGDCIVFRGEGSRPMIKPTQRKYIEDYFRI